MCLIEADKKFNSEFTLVNEILSFEFERRVNTFYN